VEDGRLHRVDHGGKEIRRLPPHRRRAHGFSGMPASAGLRLRAVDAVDRSGIIAGDDKQALDAGKARLLVVIFGIFGEIGDQIAVVGLRRRDLGERPPGSGRCGTGARRQ